MQGIPPYETLYTEISFSFTQIYIAVSPLRGQHASGTIKRSSYSHATENIHV